MELFKSVLQDNVMETSGIFSRGDIKETVWDTLAAENPMQAAISAVDEVAAAEKSKSQIAELTKNLKDGVVLDLGCGYGRIAKYLLPLRTFGGYIGLDSSRKMLSLFKEHYGATVAEQSTPVLFLQSDISPIPLKDDSIDNVVVSAVFLHNHKSVTKESIKEIRRVLKTDGKIFIYSSFPSKYSLMGLQGILYLLWLKIKGDEHRNGPVRYFSKREVYNLIKGFDSAFIKPHGFVLFPKRIIILPRILNNVYRKYIAGPANGVLRRILPESVKTFFPTHYDVKTAL